MSSCKLIEGTWILPRDTNFSGGYPNLRPGDCADAKAMQLLNESLSSVRLLPSEDNAGALFQNTGFGGEMQATNGPQSNSKTIDFSDQKRSRFDALRRYKNKDAAPFLLG